MTDTGGAAGALTWLGQATVLMETGSGTRIVFDPWLEGRVVVIAAGQSIQLRAQGGR